MRGSQMKGERGEVLHGHGSQLDPDKTRKATKHIKCTETSKAKNLALPRWVFQSNWGFRQSVHSTCAPKAPTPLWEKLPNLLVFCCTVRQVPLCPSVPACTPRTHLFPNNWAINDTQTAEQQDLLLKDSLCICRSPGVSLSQSPCQSQLQSCHHSLPPRRSFHSRATQEPIKCKVLSKSFLSMSAVIVSVWLHSCALGQFISLCCSITNTLSFAEQQPHYSLLWET